MLIENAPVTSVSDLLGVLGGLPQGPEMWFRGQSREDWNLIPSLARVRREGFDPVGSELTLIKRFKQNAAPYLASPPTDAWGWLMLMQHHGVPTRLLDWTESPLAGLYFAVADHPDTNGALWCLSPRELNKYANLAFTFAAELPSFDELATLSNNYEPNIVSSQRLIGVPPIAVIGVRSTPRMYAQLGAFTIISREPTPIENVGNGSHIGKIIIPAEAKPGLKRELALLKITQLTLFPELDNVGRIAKEVLE